MPKVLDQHCCLITQSRSVIGTVFNRFARNTRGGVATIFAVAAPVLFGAVFISVELAQITDGKAKLQAMADSAALAGAREMSLGNASEQVVLSVAKSVVDASSSALSSPVHFAGSASGGDRSAGSGSAFTADSAPIDGKYVSVELKSVLNPSLAGAIGLAPSEITAKARAKIAGNGASLCVLGLNETLAATIALSGDSKITANGCAVISNSTSTNGIGSYKNSLIKAKMICSAGGVSGGAANFSPSPTVDCPKIADPLRARIPPAVMGCDYNNHGVSGVKAELSPGVYCGGLLIANGADVTFLPGDYIIKDGPFSITHTSKVYGKYVGFYLTGSNAKITFAAGTQIEFHATKTGLMAGLLVYEDRDVPDVQIHNIVSDNARVLVGTIYIPKGIFRVGSKQPVADQSAYTAIIANKIELNKYPTIVLNSNYSQTDVPVPGGLTTGMARSVTLEK